MIYILTTSVFSQPSNDSMISHKIHSPTVSPTKTVHQNPMDSHVGDYVGTSSSSRSSSPSKQHQGQQTKAKGLWDSIFQLDVRYERGKGR